MYDYGMLLLSPCLGSLKNVISKLGGQRVRGLKKLMWLNVITALLALAVFGISGVDFSVMWKWDFLLLALLYGVFSIGSQLFYILAVDKGSGAVCSMIYSSGFLIPTLFSVFYFQETVSFFRVVGIVLLLASIYLIVRNKQSTSAGTYLIFAFLAMSSSGIIGVLQKIFTNTRPKTQLNTYLFLSFGFMLVVSLLVQVFLNIRENKDRERTEEKAEEKTNGKEIAIAFFLFVALGLCNVFANKLNLYLSGVFSGTVCFPVVNGGCIALTALLSCLLFKEKLNTLKIIGLIVGIGAIALISL